MSEVITTNEKKNSFKAFLEEFKTKTAEKIKKILSWQKPDWKNEFYSEYKYRFKQLSLEEQLWIYYLLEDYLNAWGNKNFPYEQLTESIKPFLEEDESEWAQRVLDLIVNEDIFKEDWYEFWYCMRKAISKTSESYTKEEIKIINKRVLQFIKKN